MSKKTETIQNLKQSSETKIHLVDQSLLSFPNTVELHKLNIYFYQPEYCFNIG